jgi:hypothetical protein
MITTAQMRKMGTPSMDEDGYCHGQHGSNSGKAHSLRILCIASPGLREFLSCNLCSLCSSFLAQGCGGGTASSLWNALRAAMCQTAGIGFGKATRSSFLHQKYHSPSADPAHEPTHIQHHHNHTGSNQNSAQAAVLTSKSQHIQDVASRRITPRPRLSSLKVGTPGVPSH